ncbi:FeoA family protein [Lutispora thermophila]|uniref:Ferrous iron transport protein A n=1 Tax=Lutispora thermophila DSM 19022 TaxID=1122184 RepID=A0A1M6D6D3_9FIRM|nr:ferrous iron transport protein A [Lutispora thermophila DSM 19022]
MESVIRNRHITRELNRREGADAPLMNLTQAKVNTEYVIKEIRTNDKELKDFLFTLGCYEGETVTVISVLADNYIISVKDARYSIDKDLTNVIII